MTPKPHSVLADRLKLAKVHLDKAIGKRRQLIADLAEVEKAIPHWESIVQTLTDQLEAEQDAT